MTERTGVDVPVAPPVSAPSVPEYGRSMRAFTVWATMIGAVEPQRMVERILRELELDEVLAS